jgi:hypothetical protein
LPPTRTRTGIEAILPLKQEGQTVQHFFNSYTTFSVGERWLSSSAYRNQVSSDWFGLDTSLGIFQNSQIWS